MNLDTTTSLIRSFRYALATTNKKAATFQCNYANAALELASIEERKAELTSQCIESIRDNELAKTFGEITDREREIGIAFACYVTHGRFN